jgi:hypothetical protein
MISQFMQIDINKEEREIILEYLKAYLGLHASEMSDDEQKKLKRAIEKIEAIPI